MIGRQINRGVRLAVGVVALDQKRMRPALLIAAIGLVIANGNHAIAGARRSRSLSVARCISLRLAAFLPSKIGCTGIFLASVQFKSFQAHLLLIWHSRCDDFSKGSRIPITRSFLGKAAAAQCLLSRPAWPKADRPQSTNSGHAIAAEVSSAAATSIRAVYRERTPSSRGRYLRIEPPTS
jgi:hypothetical protein